MKVIMQRGKSVALVLGFIAAFVVLSGFFPAPASAENPYDLIWLKQPVETATPGYATTLALGSAGTMYIAGTVSADQGWRAAGFYLARYSGLGQQLWIRKTVLEGAMGVKLVMDAGGNIFLIASQITPIEGTWPPADTSDGILAKFTAAGEMVWMKVIATSAWDRADGVAVDTEGRVYVAGQTYGSVEPGTVNVGKADLFVRAFDAASGEELWTKQLGSEGYEQVGGVTVDHSGNVFVAGASSGAFGTDRSNGMMTSYLLKLAASSGDLAWVKLFGRENGDAAAALTTDTAGNVVTTGYSYGPIEEGRTPSGEIELYAAKLSGASGETLWVKQVGTRGVDYSSRDIAVDAAGSVFVAGQKDVFWCAPQRTDAFITKFAGDTGQQLWEVQVSDTVMNYATALEVDSIGDVVIVGAAQGRLTEGEETDAGGMYFAKYGAKKTPSEQITAITNELRQAIELGATSGSGPGNSSGGRGSALLSMLSSTEKMIGSGDMWGACRQLSQVYAKIDAVSPPADLLEGPDLAAIAEGVVRLKGTMACP